jgi:hypothetical protein
VLFDLAGRISTAAIGSGPVSVGLGDWDNASNPGGGADAVVAFADASGLALAAGNGRGAFNQPRHVGAPGAEYVEVADFLDTAAEPDVLAINPVNDSVSVLFGEPAGGLTAPLTIAVGQQPRPGAFDDLDRDGDVDIAVPNNGSEDVSILINDGNRAFHVASSFPAGPSPQWATSGEVNGDGHSDLVVSQYSDDRTAVLFGDGTGSFGPPVLLESQPGGNVILRDFDGDGDADILLTNAPGFASLLRGDGHGAFGPEERLELLGGPIDAAVVDLDRDGDLDVAAVAPTSDRVHILLNDGRGTFVQQQVINTEGGPSGIAAWDLEGDGWPDVVTANRADDSITVFRNICGS